MVSICTISLWSAVMSEWSKERHSSCRTGNRAWVRNPLTATLFFLPFFFFREGWNTPMKGPWWRAVVVWIVIAVVEIIHGILRNILLVPIIGDWRARQFGAVFGCFLIFVICKHLTNYLSPLTNSYTQLLLIGLLWLILMISFEISAGLFIAQLSWNRILSDYDLSNGGLLGLAMTFLLFTPLIVLHSHVRRYYSTKM